MPSTGLINNEQMNLLAQVQQYVRQVDVNAEPDFSQYDKQQADLKSHVQDITKLLKQVQKGKLDKFQVLEDVKLNYQTKPYKELSPENVKVRYARSILTLAAPLELNGTKYSNKTDRYEEQTKYASDFLANYSKEL